MAFQHLKTKYGDGYVLEMKVPPAHVAGIKEYLPTVLEGLELAEEYNGRLTYKVHAEHVRVDHAAVARSVHVLNRSGWGGGGLLLASRCWR